jgi:hypothetical protein
MEKETASLVLRSYDINPVAVPVGVDNNYGTITANTQVLIFKSVNLKVILGDLYDKYDRFNLSLTSVMVRSTGIAITDGICAITLRGLTFTNQTYNTRLGLTNEAYVGMNSYNTAAAIGNAQPVSSGIITIYKITL